MRKVIYGAACSVDGLITGSQGELDWLHFSHDAAELMRDSFASVDTLLYGRKTWQIAAQAKQPPMPGVQNFLFSRTVLAPPPGIQLVRQEAGDFVRDLKQQPGKDIAVMSGGGLARSLFQAGVIDEIALNMHPLLLGSGTPLFLDAGARIGLELTECRALDGGCVLLRYRVSPRK